MLSQTISGAMAGVLYQLYAYPFDVIKTNVQLGKKTFSEMVSNKFWRFPTFK